MNKVVQLSEASSIAIHAMVLIAKADVQINVGHIADRTGASRNHLAKVMQRLVKEGLVKSTRGPSGGFLLAKDPRQISLLDIYECIEGPIEPTGCPLNRQVCPLGKCLMGGIVHKATTEIKKYLSDNKLSDMLSY
ncbi:MAG TPA: Rrf2 family transcriptional regulator [Bacteroidales bacterium]|nr:MAG: Rrf2 family transcriptional regulator [Bacteroidetes bacterium GWE2_42_24]OFY30778.1 MAG: Rrf2 family transcriptional regulator [Bacteroidetes bacterium GWF2_43_11]PKP23892.1 MAG: Rrf2 family transcriptional regulator [Bacteroidetes bacterium HGW-Bacteroidetes-22]HBZ65322.1 Rrf2 family transcriptional regulator [Bacteroidales bacterium]